ncbi:MULTISPECIES: carotenoid oxygenase family protein [Enterobacteriaceae]|uniref:carotenoid oxygenase family protein n=1 Tax=Enterobacteriaceae TaxID=543 RepID=UPI000237D448|nr:MULTISPECIES: carotenoid oxygenase family protein [Enterobacteriaceae]QNE50949.1 carotenoid oxygenase family protein [Klebsiella michiganensis]
MWNDKNPFLQGPYEPLHNEHIIDSVHIEGQIPKELNGTLYRTGGSQYYEPLDAELFHWFDGDGMVYAFRLENGKAAYCNRWVQTEALKAEHEAGHALYNGVTGHSGKPQLPLPEGAPKIKAVAGINVIRLGDRVLALHEVGEHYWELDPVTLDTIGTFNFDGQIEGALTAHPHFDAAANEWVFYALDNERGFLECFTTDPAGKVKSKHRVSLSWAPWNHDFIFTPQHYIFFFGLINARPWAVDRIPQGKSSWYVDPTQDRNAKILFVDRQTGEPTWLYPQEAEFILGHFLNAYQDGDDTVIDASITPLSGVLHEFNPENYYPFPIVEGPSPFEQPQLWRLAINHRKGTVDYRRIGDFSAEFVRPNETIQGQKHRYGYMASVHAPGPNTRGFNSLAKHDYETGTTQFQHIAGDVEFTPGEPIFVPHPQATSEDHGWVLALWYNPRRNTSELIVLDAADFAGQPVARIKLDHHVPLGFHGNWITNE